MSLGPFANAVVVRGRVTSALGVPLSNVRVQLIQGKRSVADALSGPDGTYEIRTAYSGRFLLLSAPSGIAARFAPQIGEPFYGGRADLLTMDIALNSSGITPQISSQATLFVTPNRELATPPAQIAADQLLTHATTLPELTPIAGSFLVQQGQIGNPAYVYLRGAPPQTLLATINNVTANPLGSAANLAYLSTTGLAQFTPDAAVEITPDANPLYLVGAASGVISAHEARAQATAPTLVYTGDAGNQSTYRNEAVASWARGRFDMLGAFSRFNISDPYPWSPFHLTTFASNLGYHISAGTSVRFNGRYDTGASAPVSPYLFYGISPQGRNASQNFFASSTFETRTTANWHNLLRYGMMRARAQATDTYTPAFGAPVTIYGANGSTASGIAAFAPLPSRQDGVTNRDEATYQTDYPISHSIALAGEFRYQHERAADMLPGIKRSLGLSHYAGALGIQGEFKHRLFYQASGFLDHSPVFGLTGSPRLGLAYVPVRPGERLFHGTTLHATAATGSRELSLLELAATPAGRELPRSRTFDVSVMQNILGPKLILRGTYFHGQYTHEFEPLRLSSIASEPVISQTLALRTQGFESNIRYQPLRRLLFEGGYTYLAALTERSAATAYVNPNMPDAPIGGLTALVGQRPFHRPPHTGFVLAEYVGTRFNASIKAALAAKSDDSTGLLQTPTLLLPNRNLSPGYASVDAHLSMVLTRHFTAFTQLSNLANDRHIAPIGFESNPFLIRAGLRIRIGGE